MRIELKQGAVAIAAPAKVNFFLEVLGKRSDGFHEIETVMCPIDLFDHLVIEPTSDEKITLEVQTPSPADIADGLGPNRELRESAWAVPTDASNLVVRAAERVREELGLKHGCRIQLLKRIWTQAGLGGGSSDAAAALVGCLLLWDRWDRQLAERLAAELGSDIAFFLGCPERIGLALATGRGERITTIPASPQLNMVVMHPPSGCSTKEVYQQYQPSESKRTTQEIIAACKTGQTGKIGAQLFNALQSPASKVCPWIAKQLRLLQASGHAFGLMTGSGSSCFALIESEPASIADQLSAVSKAAQEVGISRTCAVATFFAPPVEEQLTTQRGC